MKTWLSIVIVATASLTGAQGIFNQGAVWHYDYGGGAASAYAKISYVKDSLINSTTYAVLRLQKEGVSGNTSNPNHFNTTSTLLAHQTNSVIYFGNDTLYGLNFVIGTKWRLPGAGNYRCQPIVTLTDTGRANFHGRTNLKYLKVSITTPSAGIALDTIYEKIGFRNAFPYEPNSWCYADDFIQYPGAFRCYGDNVISFNVNTSKPCNSFFSLGLAGYVNTSSISIYPNPAKETLAVTGFKSADLVNINIFNLNGQLVHNYSGHANSETINLDISKLKSGIYSISGSNNNQTIPVRKLVIEPNN